MKNSALIKALSILEHKLRFECVSFRLLKEIHTETQEELAEGQIIPAHFIFPMYVDLMVDYVPDRFREIFHFHPINEPLLQQVFDDNGNRIEFKIFNKKLWLPVPELLLATKIKALEARGKQHKKIKDLCDIFALLRYTGKKPHGIKKTVTQFLPNNTLRKASDTIKDEDYEKAAQQLNHSPREIRRVMEILKE